MEATVTQSIDVAIAAASLDAAFHAHWKYIHGILLAASDGNKVISPSDLMGPIEELLTLYKHFRVIYVVPAIANTTATLGGEDQYEVAVQDEATELMREDYPHMCSKETLAASIQAAARELLTAPGTGPAVGDGDEDSLNSPANRDAKKVDSEEATDRLAPARCACEEEI
ncbi:hypothetical protein THAOC_27741 [Thalassiosira oceanica]|uniref:Uncharacterized protein n=1 Tax=Thalassiosira oceanica TaxID=159749 RepID=K0RGQ7_THAOC|nr:hypothetical protein THAOC_27741 [Thalassiosira oceanica]|eukprot:EJK52928.1 hypothetical protein THAOC_27741 [Thalassiosira oceanica]